MRLADAGRTERQQVGAFVEPGATGCQRGDLALVDHRDCGEVEGGEALAHRQMGVLQVALDASLIALGEFMLEQRVEYDSGKFLYCG